MKKHQRVQRAMLAAWVRDRGCELRDLTSLLDRRAGNRYEVLAPSGKCFAPGGQTALVCVDSADVRERVLASSLVPLAQEHSGE